MEATILGSGFRLWMLCAKGVLERMHEGSENL